MHGTINAPGGVADSVSVRGQRVILRTMSPFHGGTLRSRNECRAAILLRHHGPMTVIQAPAGLFVQRNADITPTWALCQERECTRRSGFHMGINLSRELEALTLEHHRAVTEYQRNRIALILNDTETTTV